MRNDTPSIPTSHAARAGAQDGAARHGTPMMRGAPLRIMNPGIAKRCERFRGYTVSGCPLMFIDYVSILAAWLARQTRGQLASQRVTSD